MEEKMKLVVFQLGNQRLALPIKTVDRIIQVVEIMPLPKAADYVEGIINVQGEIVPIINLRFLFHEKKKELELSDQIILLKSKSTKLGLLVDTTHEVTDVESKKIFEIEKILINTKFLKGVAKLKEETIFINDPDKFLDENELNKLATLIEKSGKSIIGK